MSDAHVGIVDFYDYFLIAAWFENLSERDATPLGYAPIRSFDGSKGTQVRTSLGFERSTILQARNEVCQRRPAPFSQAADCDLVLQTRILSR